MAHILKQIWPLGERCRCAACGCEWMVTDPADLGGVAGRLVVSGDGSRRADSPCPLCLAPCALYLPPPVPPGPLPGPAARAGAPAAPAVKAAKDAEAETPATATATADATPDVPAPRRPARAPGASRRIGK